MARFMEGGMLRCLYSLTNRHIQEVLGKWGQEAVLGWFSGPDNWQDCNGRLSAQMAQVVSRSSITMAYYTKGDTHKI